MKNSAQRAVTKEQFAAWFASAKQLHEAALKDAEGDHHNDVREIFNRIEQNCLNLEPSTFSAREHRQARRLLEKELPAWLSTTVKVLIRSGTFMTYMGVGVKRGRVQQRSARLRARQSEVVLRTQLAALPKPSAPAIEARRKTTTFSFPDIQPLRKSQLGKPLTALQRDWEAAREFATGAEDSYLLEQIATRYVPDSLRLYQSTRGSAEVLGEATALLDRQLHVLHLQVRQLLERHSDDALTALRAQTAFIEEVGRRGQPPRLSLT